MAVADKGSNKLQANLRWSLVSKLYWPPRTVNPNTSITSHHSCIFMFAGWYSTSNTFCDICNETFVLHCSSSWTV